LKRFTATEKWADPWFRHLSIEHKALWQFICDHCEPDGVWTIDLEYAAAHIGAKFDIEAAKEALGDRVLEYRPGKWWIVKFIEFQYGKLNEKCHYHRKVAECLSRHNLVELFQKHYPHQSYPTSQSPSQSGGSPSPTGREGKVQEGIVQEGKGCGENPEQKLSPLGLRVGSWFRRRPNTVWDKREIDALRKVEKFKTPEEDIALLEKAYLSKAPYIRKDVLTLLNNWNGEIDRAGGNLTSGNGHSHKEDNLPDFTGTGIRR
jgi:hypothetical protein